MLVVSVAVSGVATKVLTPILELVGLGVGARLLLWLLALALGLAANTLLFFAFFRLLAAPEVPTRSLWSGALLGAVAFELLKQLSTLLLKSTRERRAVQAFGIALILVVWINYFSRVVVYAAAWAHTSPEARAAREARTVAEQTVEGPRIDLPAAAAVVRPAAQPGGVLGLPEGRLRRRGRRDAGAGGGRAPPPLTPPGVALGRCVSHIPAARECGWATARPACRSDTPRAVRERHAAEQSTVQVGDR